MTEPQEGRSRYQDLAEGRYRLEERAEDQMNALLGTLGELRDLDERQRPLAREAGVSKAQVQVGRGVVANWIADRLGGTGGYVRLVKPWGYQRSLPQLDPLARKVVEPTEGEES